MLSNALYEIYDNANNDVLLWPQWGESVTDKSEDNERSLNVEKFVIYWVWDLCMEYVLWLIVYWHCIVYRMRA